MGEIAKILRVVRPLGEKIVGQIKDFLKVAVPRNKAGVRAKHHNAIAHIVESDAQLGLAGAQLFEQASILNRDHRLVGEGGDQLDLFVRKRIGLVAVKAKNTEKLLLAQKRNAENGAEPSHFLPVDVGIFRVLEDIGNVNRSPF